MTTDDLVACLTQRRFDVTLGREVDWTQALDAVAMSDIETFRYAAPLLAAAFPKVFYPNFMAEIARQTAGRAPLPFRDDTASDLQVVPCPGSDTALLVLCGSAHRIGMPLTLAHQWFGTLGVTVVYLRDFSRRHYFYGLNSIEGGYEATVEVLRARLKDLGIRRRLFYGNSMGTFAAVRIAIDLHGEAVLALGARTLLEPDALPAREHPMLDALPPDAETDLRRLILAAGNPPLIRVIYGADQEIDSAQAQNLAGLASVRLDPIAGSRQHNVMIELVRRRLYDGVLKWLVT